MRIEPIIASMQIVTHSRRSALRLAGAGAMAAVMSSRLGPAARAQAPFPTRIRVLHASPQLGKVEVLFNGNEVLDEFEYGSTSDWVEVKPGVVRVTIRRDRAGINYVVFDSAAPVVANEDYELIISDPIVIPAPVDRAPLTPGMARYRFVHASVDVPAIDIAQKGGEVVISNLSYGQLSDPQEVAPGSYDLEARLQGTGEVVLDMPGVTVEADQVYTLVIYGVPQNTTTPLTVASLADAALAPMPSATPTG